VPVLQFDTFTLSPFEIAACVAGLLFAYGLRGSTGFGGALGMAMLVVFVPIKVVVPAWTLLSISSSITILGHDRKQIAWKDVMPFLPWCMLGIGIGLYVFTSLDANTLAKALGVVVFIYSANALWSTLRPSSRIGIPERLVVPFNGVAAGATGTIFGTMASMFFVMYLDARKLAKQAFRATMSAMLLALAVVRGLGYFAVDEFNHDSLMVFAYAFPIMLIGIYIGNRIHLRIAELTFKRLVGVTLMACSIPLLLK
jgi:uncharacterized membrane protein YfcA